MDVMNDIWYGMLLIIQYDVRNKPIHDDDDDESVPVQQSCQNAASVRKWAVLVGFDSRTSIELAPENHL